MKEETRQKVKELSKCLCIVLIFLGTFVLTDYTQDSYLCFKEGWKEPFMHFLGLGRVSSAIFWIIFSPTNYNIMCTASGILAIIELAVAIYFMQKVIKDITNKPKISLLLSVVIVLNVFVIELFVWFEKSVLILSVLTVVLSIYNLNKSLQSNKKKYYIYSFILMIIANFSYQGTVGLFITLATLLVIKYSKNIKDFIKNNIIIVGLYAVPAIINYLYIKIFFNTSRLQQGQAIQAKILEICRQGKSILLKTNELLPKYTLVIVLTIISLIFIIKALTQKNTKNKMLNLFFLIYVIGVNALAAILPQIFQDYICILPRNTYCLGAIAGIVALLTFMQFEEFKIEEKIIKVILLIFLLLQWYNYMIAIKDHYTTNYLDKISSEQIAQEVLKYEEETGNIITKVYTCKDKNFNSMYEGMKPIGDGNIKAFNSTWGIRGILDGVLDRKLIVEESKNEEYNEYFKSKDWNAFNKEQLIFEGDTLYLGIY